jgi:hypothetical protein
MPGYLIPSDLARMIPAGADPLEWASKNLLASPGATVAVLNQQTGKAEGQRRIPTLVLAEKPDHSCIHLGDDGKCGIHETSPFACAFFDCRSTGEHLSLQGLRAVDQAWADPQSLYRSIWTYLSGQGLVSDSPNVKRRRMKEMAYFESL